MLASCPVGWCTCTDNIQTANKDRIFLALNGSKCLVLWAVGYVLFLFFFMTVNSCSSEIDDDF